MVDSWVSIFDHGWVFSVLRPAELPRYPPLILLHGLSGDETSLQTFSSGIDRSRWFIAARGILPGPGTGYAWAVEKSRNQGEFSISVSGFFAEWESLKSLLDISNTPIDLMGFSQGAALAALLLITSPNLIRRTAIISGFIPVLEASVKPNLTGHQVMISHGTADEMVPFDEAIRSTELLKSFGADVTLCQTNTRHKIGANCLDQLMTFFD